VKFLVVCRRELGSYFGSFVAYILIAMFLVLSGYFFYSDLIFFVLFGGFALPTGLWQFVFIDMRFVAMLVLPLVTMRLFAEEKRLGTIELLWTDPVRDGEIVAGKFLAAWIFFLVMLAATLVNPIAFYPATSRSGLRRSRRRGVPVPSGLPPACSCARANAHRSGSVSRPGPITCRCSAAPAST
jgi:ABC-2 type transport system permease protein